MTEIVKNYINGRWVPSGSGKTFENINPSDKNEVIGIFPRSDKDDVSEAVEAAKKAFRQWSVFPAAKKGEILFKAAQILQKRKKEISRLMTREMGKVLKEAWGDVQEGIDMLYFIAGEGRRLYGQTTTSELSDKTAFTIRVPVGTAAVITPWNFPVAIPVWKIAPALLCGNCVVFKPAKDAPYMGTKLVEILIEAGIPGGVLNLVHGLGEETGEYLLDSDGIDLISFTGSSETGRHIAVKGAETYKRVSLEMGGKNPIIVMEDADLELAVDGAVWGGFGTTGQRCTAASRLIVHKKVNKKFTEAFVEKTKRLKLGNGLDRKVDVGPVINASQLKKIDDYVNTGKKEGATILTGGFIPKSPELKKGFFYPPTIFSKVSPNMKIAKEEIFGPVTCILEASSFEEAVDIANSTSYGLSSSIYTKDVNRAFKAMRDLKAGITYINAPTIGAEVHLPFGGVKHTGNGHREGGVQVLDIFSEWKTVYVDYSGSLQKAQGIE